MRLTLDTNILVYAIDGLDPLKQAIAVDTLLRATACDMVVTTQVIGEFLAVVRRKLPHAMPVAIDQVDRLAAIFPPVLTETGHILAAAALADRHRLQFWDSVILTVARSAGVDVMLSEDMQDGATIEGVTLLDPFKPANRRRLEALLVV